MRGRGDRGFLSGEMGKGWKGVNVCFLGVARYWVSLRGIFFWAFKKEFG